MTKYCASCGAKNLSTAGIAPKFCGFCGKSFSTAFVPEVVKTVKAVKRKYVEVIEEEEIEEENSLSLPPSSDVVVSVRQKFTAAQFRNMDVPVQRQNIPDQLPEGVELIDPTSRQPQE